MTSTILTSPDCLSLSRENQQKQKATPLSMKKRAPTSTRMTTKPPARRGRPPKKAQKKTSSDKDKDFQPPNKIQKKSSLEKENSLDEDLDFCIICLQTMPHQLNRNNSIACIECNRKVHLKCANMRTSYFICENCDSE